MNTLEQSTTNVTAPSTTPAIGDTVSFHFNCDLHGNDVFTGTIIDAKESKVFKSMMYRVQPQADDRLAILDPVWVKPAQIEGVVSDDPVYDQMPALKAIEAAYQSWEIAYLAGRFEEAGRLSAIHDQLFDAHMARLFPKFRKSTNAPTSSDSGPAIASASSQVTSIDNDHQTQQTTLSPVLGASRRAGYIKRIDGAQGYIEAENGETFAFSLERVDRAMSIATGDRVTFEPRYAWAIEGGGMPGASLILVDGYSPAPRPEYRPNPTLRADAMSAKQASRQHSITRRQERAAAQRGNIARLSQLSNKNA